MRQRESHVTACAARPCVRWRVGAAARCCVPVYGPLRPCTCVCASPVRCWIPLQLYLPSHTTHACTVRSCGMAYGYADLCLSLCALFPIIVLYSCTSTVSTLWRTHGAWYTTGDSCRLSRVYRHCAHVSKHAKRRACIRAARHSFRPAESFMDCDERSRWRPGHVRLLGLDSRHPCALFIQDLSKSWVVNLLLSRDPNARA